MPLVDLHAHFPMHTRFPPRIAQEPPPVGKEFEYWAAQHLMNYQNGKPRVSLDELQAGSLGGIGSVLYDLDDEFRDATPIPEVFEDLIAQMDNVEAEVAGRVTVARNSAQVRNADNVDILVARGVAYVIVADLFYRGIATCQNAFPFVTDVIFDTVLNPEQDPSVGLTDLGHNVVDRLLQEGILVDITHGSDRAQEEIFAIARDHGNAPVISSHNSVRPVSNYPLNLSPAAVREIAQANGVIGVILSTYWLRQPAQQFFGTEHIQLLFNAIDCVHSLTGDYDHIAIGSDLDGFIKPIDECPDSEHTLALVTAIQNKYTAAADKILWGNALDVLDRGWKGV